MTDSDNGQAGAEELLSAVWRRRVRVVLRRRGGGCLSLGIFYNDFFTTFGHKSSSNVMKGGFQHGGVSTTDHLGAFGQAITYMMMYP